MRKPRELGRTQLEQIHYEPPDKWPGEPYGEDVTNKPVNHFLSQDRASFQDEDPHVIPFSHSDIELASAVENANFNLGGGEYWRR